MKNTLIHISADRFRALISGFLIVLTFSTLLELADSTLHLGTAICLMAISILVAKRTTHHFHGHHKHEGDSAYDTLPLTLLLVANILHPAVDGFSLYQSAIEQNITFAILLGVSIFLHEVFRQSALISAVKTMGHKGYIIVTTAIIGLMVGIGLGVLGSNFFHTYAYIADFATLFAYTFILGEFYFDNHSLARSKRSKFLIVTGIALGILLNIFHSLL
jgi:hypothetical protein